MTKKQPSFWFRDEVTGNALKGVDTSYDPTTSSYRFSNLPKSTVGIGITVHVTGDKKTLPGNFDLWHTVDIGALDKAARNNHDLELEKIMRLTAPVDSATLIHDTERDYVSYESPLLFKWETVEGATSPPNSAKDDDETDGLELGNK